MQQTAPGRYVGELPTDDPGSYFLTIYPGRGRGVLRAGISVPYSAEFNDKQTNWPLLETLAWQKPAGGEPGVLIHGDLLRPRAGDLLQFDTFRPTLPPAVSVRDVWPELSLLAACVFFFDVLVRRVVIDATAAILPVLIWVRRRKATPPQEERIERLRNRKAAIEGQIERRRAATRFEPAADSDDGVTGDQPAPEPVRTATSESAASEIAPSEEQEPSYTSRLLEAKRRLQRLHSRARGGEDDNT